MAEGIFGELMRFSDVEIMGDDAALVMDSLQGSGEAANSIAKNLGELRQADPQAVAVREALYHKMGIQPAPIPPTLFPAGGPPQTITVTVVRPMKFYNLIVGSSMARFFEVNSAKIKGVDQLGTSNPMHLEGFSEVSVRARFRWGTVNTSTPLILNVSLIDSPDTDRTLRASFLGVALMD